MRKRQNRKSYRLKIALDSKYLCVTLLTTKTERCKMKDVCGNELAIGDKVVTTVSNYEELRVMYVHSFTPNCARVSKTVGGDVYSLKASHQLFKIQS